MDRELQIDGAVAEPLALSIAELRGSYPAYTVATSFVHDDRTVTTTFTGARLWDIVHGAQLVADPVVDTKLRVMAQASDDVNCMVDWHEFDPSITDRLVLVAYEQDGQALNSSNGPLRLVVPGDERGRRYLRGLVRITILTQTTDDE